MASGFATGRNTQVRLSKTLPIGRKLMAEPPRPISDADLT